MPNQITFDRELREQAESLDHELLAFGYQHHRGAKVLIHRSVPRGVGSKLVNFCLLVGRDTDPAEAFAKVYGPK